MVLCFRNDKDVPYISYDKPNIKLFLLFSALQVPTSLIVLP